MASKVAVTRLKKEFIKLQQDPPPDIIAEPQENDILTCFFCFRGPPETPYHGGYYVGKLKFPKEYPMKAPAVYMLTPSGRFQINQKICISMSDFHPETWNPAWSVGTIIVGLQSFMASEELTTGGMRETSSKRKQYAQHSLAYNQKHYSHLFGGNLVRALERADEVRVKAAAEQQSATSQVAPSSRRRRTLRKASHRNTNDNKDSQTPKEEHKVKQEEEAKSTETAPQVEMTPEQLEKRRQNNAKKRAKQKAKRASAATANTHHDGESSPQGGVVEEQDLEKLSLQD